MKDLIFIIGLFLVGCDYSQPGDRSEDAHSIHPEKFVIIPIDDLPDQIGFIPIEAQLRPGRFEYYETNRTLGIYKSVYVPTYDDGQMLRYIQRSSTQDSLEINGFHIPLGFGRKLDPLSILVFEVSDSANEWLLITGKSTSSSGSGSKRTFYLLVDRLQLTKNYKFDSFFGSIKNIGYCGRSEEMKFIKIVPSPNKTGNYIVRVTTIVDTNIVINSDIELVYLQNDSFMLEKYDYDVCPVRENQ